MKDRFNPKIYLGKVKTQSEIQKGISKYWIWDKGLQEYISKSYVARKSVLVSGTVKVVKEHFNSLEEARLWIYGVAPAPTYSSILFDQALQSWLDNEVAHRAKTTQAYYAKALKFFNYFKGLHMEQINPMKIDEWITYLKVKNENEFRFTFERELSILSQIFKYHAINYYGFINPVNANHNKKVKVKDIPPKNKDFLEPDFIKFREELLKLKNGLALATLATVEYYHALRIGEAAGLFWEDISFNEDYSKRKIKIVRSVKWIRERNLKETYIEDNFKNSKFLLDGIKEYIIQPEVYEYLLNYKNTSSSTSGLIFHIDGKPLDYRYIQYRYDKAFRAAKLPFSSTHIMRHGGTRNELEQHGDLTLSQQRLGNNSMETTKIYAQRSNRALANFTIEKYKKQEQKKALSN